MLTNDFYNSSKTTNVNVDPKVLKTYEEQPLKNPERPSSFRILAKQSLVLLRKKIK